MKTQRLILVERKPIDNRKTRGKKINGLYEFRLSIRTNFYEDGIYGQPIDFEVKEILFLDMHETPNKYAIVGGWRKGKDYTSILAKNLLQNKEVIDNITDLFYKPKNYKTPFKVSEYLPGMDELVSKLLNVIEMKREEK